MGRGAYGSKAHLLNIIMYMLGLLPLTHLIVMLRPTMENNGTDHNITMMNTSFTEVLPCFVLFFLPLLAWAASH